MSRSFSAWKNETLACLVQLERKYKEDEAVKTLDTLIKKLLRLRKRDLSVFLVLLKEASRQVPEVLDLTPSPHEVAEWFREEGEE